MPERLQAVSFALTVFPFVWSCFLPRENRAEVKSLHNFLLAKAWRGDSTSQQIPDC